jgi:HEAT repeat protein
MPTKAEFLATIASENIEARFAAWRAAGQMDPDVAPDLLKLSASDKPGVAKAAAEALTTMTHSVGKDPAHPKRAGLVQALLAQPSALSFRLLSLIGQEAAVPTIAKSLVNAELFEEVVYCLERIPGQAPLAALVAAYPTAAEANKPRILAALGHRRSAEAVSLCVREMTNRNPEIATAATRAFGRIGIKPATPVVFPTTQSFDNLDAQLRLAEATKNLALYKTFLDHPLEHIQCAAIIGIAKIGTPEAAAAIHPKLKSTNVKVRITAQNSWKNFV